MAGKEEPCMELALLPPSGAEDDDAKQPLKRPASAVDSDEEGQPLLKKPWKGQRWRRECWQEEESAGKKTAGKKAAAKAKPKSQPAPKIQVKDKDTFADKARKWKLAQKKEGQDVSEKGSEVGTKQELAKARKFKRMSDQQAIPSTSRRPSKGQVQG